MIAKVIETMKNRLTKIFLIGLVVGTMFYFVDLDRNSGKIGFKAKFDQKQFDSFVKQIGELSVYVGLLSLAYQILAAFYGIINKANVNLASTIARLGLTTFYAGLALVMFNISIPRYLAGMHIKNIPQVVPQRMQEFSSKLDHLQLTHSYGLFRR